MPSGLAHGYLILSGEVEIGLKYVVTWMFTAFFFA